MYNKMYESNSSFAHVASAFPNGRMLFKKANISQSQIYESTEMNKTKKRLQSARPAKPDRLKIETKPKRNLSAKPIMQIATFNSYPADTVDLDDQIKLTLEKIDRCSTLLSSPIKITDLLKCNSDGIEKQYFRDIYSINVEISRIHKMKRENQKKNILKIFRLSFRLIKLIGSNSKLRIQKPHLLSNLGRLIQNISKICHDFNIGNEWDGSIMLNALENGLKNIEVEENDIIRPTVPNIRTMNNRRKYSNNIPQSSFLKYITNI